jgi:hypothetical protein
VGGSAVSVLSSAPDKRLYPLAALVRRPGARASDLGQSAQQVGAKLRRLHEAGLVQPRGPSPARWYPTTAGRRLVNQQLLGALRERAQATRQQTLAAIARAEALYAFADSLTEPVPRVPLLCPPPRHRSLSFGALVRTLKDSIGCDVLISTDTAERIWPTPSPIIAVGIIDNIEEERGLAVEDWLIRFSIADTAFVEFSRRYFQSADEDNVLGELRVHQERQMTVICFEPAGV